MLITQHAEQSLHNKIVLEDGKQLSYFGIVEASRKYNNHYLIIASNLEIPDDLGNNKQLNIHNSHIGTYYANARKTTLTRTTTGVTTAPEGDLAFVKHVMNDTGITIVSSEEDAHYTRLSRLADVLNYLCTKKPIYSNIIHNDKLVTIVDLLFISKNCEKFINQMLFSVGNARQLVEVAERILTETETETLYNPVTQEEQISMFLAMNKQKDSNVEELVSDNFIQRMTEHQAYDYIKERLETGGFSLSETQQFNSLQHAGLILSDGANVMYNLSDMGAGKTLMTVESIMYAQKVTVLETIKKLRAADTSNLVEIKLPAIHIIAPTLSLKSSWLKTFELFEPLEQKAENHYQYVMREGEYEFIGDLFLSGFTVKSGNIHVNNLAPNRQTHHSDYLIIDEIHQLINRRIKADKFIEKTPYEPIDIYNNYKTFVLSGTLANLDTTQWYNMIQFLNIPNHKWGTLSNTTAEFTDEIETSVDELRKDLANMAENLAAQQNREFDPSYLTNERVQHTQPKLTWREQYFQMKYGTSIIQFPANGNNDIAHHLTHKTCDIINDPSVFSTPNFELFYQLVSQSVVTAQSIQIATELFGDQAEQHKAQVIKTTSPLTSKDLELLKRLHKIVDDADIYKSHLIAKRIANAILNLNDGLQSKSIYDILNDAAKRSTNFLSYLTKMDLELLEDIANSNLIHLPKLENTEKFRIVKDILDKEKDETFLIVVNTPDVAIRLSKALGVESLKDKEMRNDLEYQDVIDALYTKQNIVVVPQHMIKSSLDLVQANRLIQYQLNTDISDIIQTQNRINRIGQTRETKAYYIATDVLQENIIELFLETYRNIKVAHKGIVELFVDMEQQIDVVSDYLANALENSVVDDQASETEITRIVKVNGQEIKPDIDTLAMLSDDDIQGIWYGSNILVKSPTGNTLILAQMHKESEKPQLVDITIERL